MLKSILFDGYIVKLYLFFNNYISNSKFISIENKIDIIKYIEDNYEKKHIIDVLYHCFHNILKIDSNIPKDNIIEKNKRKAKCILTIINNDKILSNFLNIPNEFYDLNFNNEDIEKKIHPYIEKNEFVKLIYRYINFYYFENRYTVFFVGANYEIIELNEWYNASEYMVDKYSYEKNYIKDTFFHINDSYYMLFDYDEFFVNKKIDYIILYYDDATNVNEKTVIPETKQEFKIIVKECFIKNKTIIGFYYDS